MTPETLTLIVAHLMCSDAASERLLSQSEAASCGAVYQSVKLAFVAGVDADDFTALSFGERARISRAGFAAFHRWRQANPSTMDHLRAVARGEDELASAG